MYRVLFDSYHGSMMDNRVKGGHEACGVLDSDDSNDFTCDICVSNRTYH